jgi:hypothetical protein
MRSVNTYQTLNNTPLRVADFVVFIDDMITSSAG